jgi:hypothetical protein
MPTRKSSAIPPVIPASVIRTALGDALGRIRSEEGLTWVELAELIGKGDDQTTRYVDASASMDVATFYRAKQLWNGRFTGEADRLISPATPEQHGQAAQSLLLKAALALSVALEDGKLTVQEIRDNRSTLEQSRDAIEALLGRLTVRAA